MRVRRQEHVERLCGGEREEEVREETRACVGVTARRSVVRGGVAGGGRGPCDARAILAYKAILAWTLFQSNSTSLEQRSSCGEYRRATGSGNIGIVDYWVLVRETRSVWTVPVQMEDGAAKQEGKGISASARGTIPEALCALLVFAGVQSWHWEFFASRLNFGRADRDVLGGMISRPSEAWTYFANP